MNAEDKIIENLEHFMENNGGYLCAPFLESEKHDIKNEVLGEVAKLEARIAELEDKLRWRDCGRYLHLLMSMYDDEGNVLPYVPSTCYQRSKRIRSILRRLKGCVKCHGAGKVPELEERGGPWMEYNVLVWEECPVCGGTGRVKEEK